MVFGNGTKKAKHQYASLKGNKKHNKYDSIKYLLPITQKPDQDCYKYRQSFSTINYVYLFINLLNYILDFRLDVDRYYSFI